MQFGFQVSRVRNAVKIDSERAGLRGYTSGERSEAAIEKIQTFNAFIKIYACAQSGQCPFDLFIFRRGAAEQRSFVPDVLPDRKAAERVCAYDVIIPSFHAADIHDFVVMRACDSGLFAPECFALFLTVSDQINNFPVLRFHISPIMSGVKKFNTFFSLIFG